MPHPNKYLEPVMNQYHLLVGLIPFIHFQGGDFLLGEDPQYDLRRQPLICYWFKMDWIGNSLINIQRKLFRIQDCIIIDGIVDAETVDTCLELFGTVFDVLEKTIENITNVDCICPREDITDEVLEAKTLEIEVQEAKVKHLLKHCKTSIFQFSDKLRNFLCQLPEAIIEDF